MTAGESFILFAGEGATPWRVGHGGATLVDVEVPENSASAAIVDGVRSALDRLGYAGQGVLFAIPSAWCIAATISTHKLPHGDRKAMLFALEERLPLAAEEIVADFIPHNGNALGVCARLDELRPVVDALESRGISVQSVTPTALLALQSLGNSGDAIVLWAEGGEHVNVFSIRNGKPVSWSLLPADAADLQPHLKMLEPEAPARAHAIDATLAAAVGADIVSDESPETAAARLAGDVIDGRIRPWIDLRRGPLAAKDSLRRHRRALNAALAAAAVFLLVLCGVMLFRGHRYDRAARAADDQLASEFARTFPGWPAGANVRAVIESEHRKLLSVAAPEARESASGTHSNALRMMLAVLNNLPKDVRFQIDRMTFEDSGFELQGRLKNFEDADKLVAAAHAAGADASPPQATRGEDGMWTFTLHGTRAAAPDLTASTASP